MRWLRLRLFTLRGRSFLAAGAATLLAGMALGYEELLRVGALVVLLPVISAFWVALRPHRMVLTRTGVPIQLPVGQNASIQISLTNRGEKNTGIALMTERLPSEFGHSPRFAVDSMQPGTRRQIDYRIHASKRGRYDIGPLEARLVDPFGFVEARRTFATRQSVVVTPHVEQLPVVALQGGPSGSGERRARQFLTGSLDDSTVRDYRRGDDLRRIHWRSSAHHDHLMVRCEEQPWHSRATIVLDTRAAAFVPSRSDDPFERAVSFAASIGVHLIRRDFAVRIVETDGTDLSGGWHLRGSNGADENDVLEELAIVTPGPRAHVASNLAAGIGGGEIVIFIHGRLSPADDESLRPLAARGTTALAFAIGTTEGPSHPWVVTPVPSADSFREAWLAAMAGLRVAERLSGAAR